MRRLILILSCLLILKTAIGQSKTTFGIQFRPIVPSGLFGDDILDVESDDLTASIESAISQSFGAIIRNSFTDRWSLETAINITRRNYSIASVVKSTGEEIDVKLRSASYEIPIQALYYVQLGDDFYMNALAGCSFNVYPTQLFTTSDDGQIAAKAARNGWIGLAILANVGFEYRTSSAGYFYLGASLHRPIKDIYQLQIDYRPNVQTNNSALGLARGNYLSIDLRYFFPADADDSKRKR